MDYIIVQAGGKGSRMKELTRNKPKALVPIQNLPMLFHLFEKFPNKKFIIIGDYKADVLKKYLATFSKVDYLVVDAHGKKGTCGGIKEAISLVPAKKSFMLIWSDLVLADSFSLPEEEDDYVGLSGDFPCRWKYENEAFIEEPSVEYGVAGLFIFKDRSRIQDVPAEGEFVRYLQSKKDKPKVLVLQNTKEYGLLEVYNKELPQRRCRPFNRMSMQGDRICKEGIDEQGKQLAIKEKEWYQSVEQLGYTQIPTIYSYDPFVMECIHGKNIYEYGDLDKEKKKEILDSLIVALRKLHLLGSIEVDAFSVHESYVKKTFDRVEQVRNLIPFANDPYITINGRRCRNLFFFREEVEKKLEAITPQQFSCIHGDCTFSNTMMRENGEAVLIDPRGYFGKTKLYGDVAYDWAKLYYSIAGNYDQFNQKNFSLEILENQVKLTIGSNGFEELSSYYLQEISNEVDESTIKLLHGAIWLSLTTYAWEDYDSICGAFYNGLYYLEEVL